MTRIEQTIHKLLEFLINNKHGSFYLVRVSDHDDAIKMTLRTSDKMASEFGSSLVFSSPNYRNELLTTAIFCDSFDHLLDTLERN